MEDVTKLTKEEFLKFLNCVQNSIIPETVIYEGTNNCISTVVKRFAKYRACNVTIDEFSLNNQILRIPLPSVNLSSLTPKQVAYRFRKPKSCNRRIRSNEIVSRFGRPIKNRKFLEPSVESEKRTPNFRLKRQLKINNNKLNISKQNMDFEPSKPATIEIDILNKENFGEKQAVVEFLATHPTFDLKYYLKPPPEDIITEGLLQYGFNDLVRDIKNMKLPSPTWKIKVVVRSTKISSIIFTNKCVLERTVTFNSKSDLYEIVIENKPAILLGSPGDVTCVEDIEILLNIIHTINADDVMIRYKD